MRRLAAWMAMGLALPGLAAAAEGWEGRVEVSYTRTSGNTDTEALAASAGARLEAGGNRYAASASGLYGETEGEPTASRWAADARYERVLTGRLFGFVSAAYLKDTYAGYDARVEIGPGAGYDVVKTEAHGLAVAVGLLWNYDNFTAGPEASDTYASAKAAAEYTWRVSQAVAFGQAVDYSVSLDDTDVYSRTPPPR